MMGFPVAPVMSSETSLWLESLQDAVKSLVEESVSKRGSVNEDVRASVETALNKFDCAVARLAREWPRD